MDLGRPFDSMIGGKVFSYMTLLVNMTAFYLGISVLNSFWALFMWMCIKSSVN